jgi:hypothetical protein
VQRRGSGSGGTAGSRAGRRGGAPGDFLLDLEVEVPGPPGGGPAGARSKDGGGDAAAASLGPGGHAEHPGPTSFDHQHAHAEHVAVAGRGEEAGLGTDPGEDQPAGRLGVRAALHRGPAGEPLRTGGGGDRYGRRRDGRPTGEQAVDRRGRHHRRRLAAVASGRQLAVELAVQFRRTDLDDRRLVAPGVEPLSQVEDLGALGRAGIGRHRGREGRVGAAAGDGGGVAQQPPVDQLDGRGRPGVHGELLEQQDRLGDHVARNGQGLADRPVQRRRDCQEEMARVALAPWRGMGMPPEMTAGTQREAVMARPWVVRRRTPDWAVRPPRE